MAFDRRQFLHGSLATCALAGLQPLWASHAHALKVTEPLAELKIWGPPAGPSITLLNAIATGKLKQVARKMEFRAWRNPDEVRAGLTSSAMQVGVMPVAAAANLYNRGMPLRLVNVMTNGLLYIISADESITSLEALKGKSLAALFPNETPTLLLNRLFKWKGVDPQKDLTIKPTATPIEAVQLLLTWRAKAALVPEPAATAAIVKGKQFWRSIARVIDIQEQWGMLTGTKSLPQAGLVVTEAFLEAHPGIVQALQNGLAEAVNDVNADPARAAKNTAGQLIVPDKVIKESIATSNLVAIPARDVRPQIETMLKTVAEGNSVIINGKLPDAQFYL